MTGPELLLAIAVGYLVGAIPSGVLIGRLRGIDPRSSGSGRTGTTNAMRTLGVAWAALVLVLDVAKGVLAVAIGEQIALAVDGSVGWAAALAGVAAVVGHVRSVFIGFGGGRGVATGGGVLLVLVPIGALVAIAVFALIVWRTRYVSAGSMAAAITLALVAGVLLALGRGTVEALAAACLVAVVVVLAHADNIERLRAGTERQLGRG